MKLVYDLRYACDAFPGIGTHAYGLAAALLALGACESITFLWNPGAPNTRFDFASLRAHPHARWLEVPVPPLAAGTAHRTGRLLAGLQPDLYLSPFWLLPEGCSVPCVLTLHDVLPLALPGTMNLPRRWLYTWALRRAARAAAILTSSRFSHDEILRLTSIPSDRLHVVPLGVEPPVIAPVRPAGLGEGAFALVIGANRAHKRHETLAQVWRGFGDTAPLRLVWAGPWNAGGRPLSEMSSRTGMVQALGQVDPAGLEWLYRHATLVLSPSRYEGFGLPVLEAAARRVPVVASDIPAHRETGASVARLVPPDDVAGWQAAIRELAADAEKRTRMAAAGVERVAAFNYAACAARVEQVLQQVYLGARGVPA